MALMIASGLILGTVLDIYRVLKNRLQLRGWVVSLIDLLYWTVAAGLVFSLLMWSNWGELRFFIFLGVLTGFGAYYTWLSQGMIQVIRWVIRAVERIFAGLVRLLYVLIWLPAIYIWIFFLTILRFFGRLMMWIFSPFGRLMKSCTGWITRWLQPLVRLWHWIKKK